MLRNVSAERKVQRPSQRHAQLLLEGRELGEVDRPPQPPGEEAREAQSKNVRHSGVMPDRSELAQSPEAEGCFLRPTDRSDDVLSK
jgi:hypothetical protein